MEGGGRKPRILFVDAYDSFSENIGALLAQTLDAYITFVKIDSCISYPTGLDISLNGYDALVLGPGPGNPAEPSDIGIIPSLWSVAQANAIPVLGICLGFQSLCLTFGVPVVRMPLPCHGLTKTINHSNKDIFSGAGDFVATNYNSLAVRIEDILETPVSRPESACSTSSNSTDVNSGCSTPERVFQSLIPLAWDNFGWLMGVRHGRLPFWGLQFHPESCKSSKTCHHILRRWWDYASEWNRTHRPTILPKFLSLEIASVTDLEKKSSHDSVGTQVPNFPHLSVTPQESQSSVLRRLTASLLELSASSGSTVQTAVTKLTSREHIADLCYEDSSNWTAFLESTKKGRYSIYAIPSSSNWRLELSSQYLVVSSDAYPAQEYSMHHSDIFDLLKSVLKAQKATGGDSKVPFWGGFLGFFSYEMGLKTAGFVPNTDSRSGTAPEVSLVWVERSVVIDHLEGQVYVQSIRRDDSTWIQKFVNRITCSKGANFIGNCDDQTLDILLANAQTSLPSEDAYKANINACQQHLQAGNSYELCLTVETKVKLAACQSWPLYKNLSRCNPVPFAAFLRLGKTTILSSSPEQFLSWNRQGTIDMVPMKGTVKKSTDMTFAKASDILASPKESAENLMIADLIRHDLYRALGSNASVEVVKLCEVVEHETVYQLVSHIRANPPDDIERLPEVEKQAKVIECGLTALQQTMPPGSMTGAPKKRSCEILSQLEQRPRGVYSGVLGYLDVGGGGGFSVCIRTAFSSDDDTENGLQTWRIGAGGAITVLSDVDAEWEEMRTKMESVLRAFRPRE
jgi:para-aminobenzoate synthetase